MPLWLRAAAFIAMLPAAIGGWIPWLIAGPRTAPSPGAAPAIAVFALGWAIVLWCAYDFVRRGRGTPAPYDPPRALVTGGLYTVTRNPMYVGVLTAVAGEAIAWPSWRMLLYAAVVALGFHARVVLYEEPRLSRSFGADFARYCARVPRWFALPWRPRRSTGTGTS